MYISLSLRLETLQTNPKERYGFRPVQNHGRRDNDQRRFFCLENQQAARGKTSNISNFSFIIQIAASQAAGSTFNQPGRTLMTLSVNAYVDVAHTLRDVYIMEPSERVNGFTVEKKGDVLRQLRKQFENARKMFTFSIANASKYLHPLVMQSTYCLLQVTDWPPPLKLLKSPTLL